MAMNISRKNNERKALKKNRKSKSKTRHKDETPKNVRKAREKEKKVRKVKSEGAKGVEDLLSFLGRSENTCSRRQSRTSPLGRRRQTFDSQVLAILATLQADAHRDIQILNGSISHVEPSQGVCMTASFS